jgi:hypothetical protein
MGRSRVGAVLACELCIIVIKVGLGHVEMFEGTREEQRSK